MRLCVVLLAVASIATPAAAQSTYVSGSLLGEFSRFADVDVDAEFTRLAPGYEQPSRNHETIGFDLRAGRGLGERWGVEFGFARGGSSERRRTQQLLPGISTPVFTPTLPTIPGLPVTPTLPIPIIEFEVSVEDQSTTLEAVAWVRQDLGSRVDLAFLGGVSFARVEGEQTLRLTDPRLAIYAPYPQELETVQYGVGPLVGAEAIIELTDHVAATGGVRLHGVNAGASGWLIRPSAGLRWTF